MKVTGSELALAARIMREAQFSDRKITRELHDLADRLEDLMARTKDCRFPAQTLEWVED
mgnify:CR=1 FL=1